MSKPGHLCAKIKPVAKIAFYVRLFSNFAADFRLNAENVFEQ